MARRTLIKIIGFVLGMVLLATPVLSACTFTGTPSYPAPPFTAPGDTIPASPQVQAYPTPLDGTSAGADPLPESPQPAASQPADETACQAGMQVEAVALPAADGLEIRGDLYLPSTGGAPLPGVILLHMLYENRRSWGEFPRTLAGECYVVLAIDLRGHGETSGQNDWEKARDDLLLVVEYLAGRPEVDPEKIALVGASVGANLALVTAAASPSIPTVVLLSPGLDYVLIRTLEALVPYGERPLLIFASDEDTYAADSSKQLDEAARGEHRLVLFQGAGHGTDMFARERELPRQIMDWLQAYLQ